MKKLLPLLLFLCACNIQQRDIKRLHLYNYQYPSELAKDCVKTFPVKDSIGTPVLTAANNIDYSGKIDSLKRYADSVTAVNINLPNDTAKLKRIVTSQAGQIKSLSNIINALHAAYNPCKHDTLKIPIYKKDLAGLKVLQNAYSGQHDSLTKAKTQLTQKTQAKNTWMEIAIGLMVLLVAFLAIKVYSLFNGGWITGLTGFFKK